MILKKLTAIALSAALILPAAVDALPEEAFAPLTASAEYVETYSGTCGKNITWSITVKDLEYGPLTISGNGEMENFSNESNVPWCYYRDKIKEIHIDKGITNIGDYAFYKCEKVKSITVPNSVTSIGKCAFLKCTSLTKVKMYDTITSIENYTFSNCTSLSYIDIPDSVTSIGKYAFSDCTSLDDIDIPASVETIELSAFPDNLYFIRVDENNQYYSSEYGFLLNKDKSELIMCPRGKKTYTYDPVRIPVSVKTIGKCAFENCTHIESLNIPDSVTSIEEQAFYKCTSLKSITIPDSVTSIGQEAFNKCTSLESTIIPDSVTSIGKGAFMNCKSLKSVTIPASVTIIGEFAFRYCPNIETVTILNPECTIEYHNNFITNANEGFVNNTAAIKGYKGSTAEDYARELGYSFIALDEAPAHKYGDANDDGDVTVSDAVTILQYIGNKDKYNLDDTQKKYADVDGTPGITGMDALTIQKVDAGLINKNDLPLKA